MTVVRIGIPIQSHLVAPLVFPLVTNVTFERNATRCLGTLNMMLHQKSDQRHCMCRKSPNHSCLRRSHKRPYNASLRAACYSRR